MGTPTTVMSPEPRRWRPAIAALLLLAGCDRADPRWTGFIYTNLTDNAAPGVTVGFASAEVCLATMRARVQALQAPLAGFACARDCTTGALFASDCRDVRT